MFNWQGIAQEIGDYTLGTDGFIRECCYRLFDINPDAQSVDDFEYEVFSDVLVEVEEEGF